MTAILIAAAALALIVCAVALASILCDAGGDSFDDFDV